MAVLQVAAMEVGCGRECGKVIMTDRAHCRATLLRGDAVAYGMDSPTRVGGGKCPRTLKKMAHLEQVMCAELAWFRVGGWVEGKDAVHPCRVGRASLR